MRFLLALLSLTVLCVGNPVSARTASSRSDCRVSVRLPAKSAVLVGKEARSLLKQCSRQTPANVTGYWTPTSANIAQLERDAAPYFRGKPFPHGLKFTSIYRQYMGFTRKGHKFIYLNAAASVGPFEKGKWKTQAMIICDGGSSFFGAEYDVQSRKFSHVAFNGPG